jgi:hypothetical protein
MAGSAGPRGQGCDRGDGADVASPSAVAQNARARKIDQGSEERVHCIGAAKLSAGPVMLYTSGFCLREQCSYRT